jgi:hypothetical protein
MCQFYSQKANNNNNNNNNNNIAILGDRNVIRKEAKKILKYKDLITEIQRMWNVKTKVTPVITGATGTISESFSKYLRSVPGKHDIKELQKTAILGTAHTHTAESANVEAQSSLILQTALYAPLTVRAE